MNEHLTTSRVHRLLRPLRNKCLSLAALQSSSRTKQSDRPPLSVISPPAGAKKLILDSADEFELSRRIYAVCDAFKNIVHVAYLEPCQSLLSLAAMCTLVIGGDMPVTSTDVNLPDPAQDSAENQHLDVDAIYESVPPHYRSFLIVSHALSMILSICTHHYTLIAILLDHCLSIGLIHESTLLLNIVLAQALLPPDPSCPPPVTHPAHTNFLLDLHAKWIAGGKSSSGPLLFTTSAFCQAVLGTLSQSSASHNLWTSNVLDRLFHVVESDLDSYTVITYTLSGGSWTSPNDIQDGVQPRILSNRLCELMSRLFDLLFLRDNSDSAPEAPEIPSRIYTVIDLLHNCYAAQLHTLRASSPGSSADLPDIIIVFVIHILVRFRELIDNPNRLLAILDDLSPIPTTFSKLMVYFSRLSDHLAFGDFIEAFFEQLKVYSSVLCCEKLFALDASLWACALHHFETSIASSKKDHSALVTGFKQRLMETVDAAERRCFGSTMTSSPVVSLPLGSSRPTKRGRLSGHWEWEDMVGAWIRNTPIHKKSKAEDLRSRDALISKIADGSFSASTPLSNCHGRSFTHSPTSSSQYSESDGSSYHEECDKENYPSSPSIVRRSRPARRRSSNFFSLIADAQTNRIILHPKTCSNREPTSIVQPSKHVPSLHIPRNPKPKRQISYRHRSSIVAPRTIFSSDDSLDLFAHATSSPARC